MAIKSYTVEIDFKSDVEESLSRRVQPVNAEILHRVIAYDCNNRPIIDCKSDADRPMTQLANRLSAVHIATMILSMDSQADEHDCEDKPSEELFQAVSVAELMGMRLISVRNDLLGLACLGTLNGDIAAQKLAARYFFTNFWAEFTGEVLSEYRLEPVSKKKSKVLLTPPDMQELKLKTESSSKEQRQQWRKHEDLVNVIESEKRMLLVQDDEHQEAPSPVAGKHVTAAGLQRE